MANAESTPTAADAMRRSMDNEVRCARGASPPALGAARLVPRAAVPAAPPTGVVRVSAPPSPPLRP